MRIKLLSSAVAVCIAGALAIGTPAASATQDDVMTLTLVRHAESVANASGVIDTAVPGSALTALGVQQAIQAADRLSQDDPDGVFASSMVRTQQTALYLADEMGEQVDVLPGLREIAAGVYEGQPQKEAGPAMYAVFNEWLSGKVEGRLPGSEGYYDFMDRFSGAVRTIYATGDRRPVAFSHGAAIAVWTLMTVSNPRFELFESQPLPNTGYVVIEGNPTDGWRLVDWNGTTIG